MGKGRFVIWSVSMAAALSAFAWYVLRPHEPIYQGKPLSFWLWQAYQSGAHQMEGTDTTAERAIRALGTNAVPYLVNLASTGYTPPRMLLGALAHEPNLACLHLPRQEHKYEMAIWGFRLLGPEAAPAVPALIRLLNEDKTFSRMDAAACLARIGPGAAPAVPALLAGLQTTNTNSRDYQNFRYWSLFALGEIGPAAKVAIPQLEGMTNDVSAKLALLKIKGESLRSFMEQLADTSDPRNWTQTAWLIGSMGTNGEPAIPLLLKAIANTNRALQPPALGALGEIHRQPDLCVPAIIPFLRATNLNHRRMAIYAIRNFGEAAKPAVPDLLRCLNDSDGWIQQQATNALRLIDPATAAKVLGKSGP